MRKPNTSILVVGVLFLALGVLDLWRAIAPLSGSATRQSFIGETVPLLAIGIAALVGGTFVLRGHNWARWLLAAWMAFHVVISIGKPTELIAHLIIFGFIAFLLFRPPASAHFGST